MEALLDTIRPKALPDRLTQTPLSPFQNTALLRNSTRKFRSDAPTASPKTTHSRCPKPCSWPPPVSPPVPFTSHHRTPRTASNRHIGLPLLSPVPVYVHDLRLCHGALWCISRLRMVVGRLAVSVLLLVGGRRDFGRQLGAFPRTAIFLR